jgi:predicted MFS family arabinose efflux permease
MGGFLFNRALRILLITNGLILLAGAMLGPIYALFIEKIGGDLLDASLTGGLFALAAGITTLIAGNFVDRNKRDELIVAFGYLVMGVGFFLYLFVNSLLFLLVVQVVIGFAEAFYSPAFDSLYSKHITKMKTGKEWGAWESMNYFARAIGSAIGGLIVFSFGFNAIFVVMSALSFISAITIFSLPKQTL